MRGKEHWCSPRVVRIRFQQWGMWESLIKGSMRVKDWVVFAEIEGLWDSYCLYQLL